MVQWVREKGYAGFEKALKKEAKSAAAGRPFNWVGWFVTIALNLLRDEKRREKTLRQKVGWRAPLERVWEEARGDVQRGGTWTERPDERWGSVEDQALWAVMVDDLRRAVFELGPLDRLIVAGWATRPNNAAVARALGITPKVAGARRKKALEVLKQELKAMGYTAVDRPREERNVWGFTGAVEWQQKEARATRAAGNGVWDEEEARVA